MNTNKPLVASNADNVLRQAFNKEDASITVNGFLAGQVGRKVTLQLLSTTVEVWRMFDVVTSGSCDISGTNITNIPSNVMSNLKVGQHVLTAYNDYDITIVSLDVTTNSAVISGSTVNSGAATAIKFCNLLIKYELTYDTAAKENLMDAERVG